MKKEYLILVVVIAALCAYLILHNEDRTHYALPVISPVEAKDITSISLEKQGKIMVFTRKGDTWVVSDKEYPADASKMDKIVGYIKDLTVTALVSESRDLSRYELDPDHRIAVVAKKGDTVVRKFDVGKAAPTYRHTFVSIEGQDGVFHASQNFRREFEADLDGFRDKKVLSFDSGKAVRVSVEKGELSRVFNKKIVKSDKAEDPETVTWHKADGTLQTNPSVDGMVSMLSDFTCSGFFADDTRTTLEGASPLCRISIDMEGANQVMFTMFPKDADGKYSGLSSGSSYPFLMDSYQGDDVLKKVDGLLGIEENKTGTKEN
ncbi:MAG: DUF4340 domain-containing protein [Pseudomonadota bacterium]